MDQVHTDEAPNSSDAQRPETGSVKRGVVFKSDSSLFRNLDFRCSGKPKLAGHGISDTSSFREVLSKWKALESKPETGSVKRGVSFKSDSSSLFRDVDFRCSGNPKEEPQCAEGQPDTHLDSVFSRLEEEIVAFVKGQLQRFRRVLSSESPESSSESEEEQSSTEAVLNITLDFLRRMNQQHLAQRLSSKKNSGMCQQLKSRLKEQFTYVYEGVTTKGSLLQNIYTELNIIEGGASEVYQEPEFRHTDGVPRKQNETTIASEDIIKQCHGVEEPIRTVLTKGVAGVGKTVLTQKFSLDWAEGRANQDIDLLFPFTFRQLNVLRDTQFSLVGLLHHFFSEIKGVCSLEDLQVLFIFDGLDECQLDLNFVCIKHLTDIRVVSPLEVLLVNLIRGCLFPSARVWITARSASANQIPEECVSLVTEVRGFTELQKEQYFRKRFIDEQKATVVISHIKSIRSLHIMCRIPVFCWILSTVMQKILGQTEEPELPKTLTEMYIHFLVVQAKVKSHKYDGRDKTDAPWTPQTREIVWSLGKLAFEQLQEANLIFDEVDLSDCCLDAAEIARSSGVFTQVFREEPGLYKDKIYCFIHQSVQEFLAALHVHQTFYDTGINLLSHNEDRDSKTQAALYCAAVDWALQSPNENLNMFLRFLLGLSLSTNQSLLYGLITTCVSGAAEDTVEYIKEKLNEEQCTENSINLLHCLIDMDDSSLVDEVQQFLRSGRLEVEELTAVQWSALVFLLLSSDSVLEEFDLKKYSASEEALLRLLPVIKASTKVKLADCHLSDRICSPLSSVLCSQSILTHLDLSDNDLQDSGVELLCFGLKSPFCKLENLRLAGCLVSEVGCTFLAAALRSNPSHLRELDISHNHPGEAGAELLSVLQRDPQTELHTLRLKPGGVQWMMPGPRKYHTDLELATDSAHRRLLLSEDKRTVTHVTEEQEYLQHSERFETCPQVLCSAPLTARCYWEVEWSGLVSVSVSEAAVKRTGDRGQCMFGENLHSWRLMCSSGRFSVCHNSQQIVLASSGYSSSGRAAVFLDFPAGSLQFYKVVGQELVHLHTFNHTFSQPVFAAFGVWSLGSSVKLKDVKEHPQL